MALSIRVDALEADGVTLISPERPEFDGLARPLMGERISDLGLKLKPLLVIVSNQSPQTVVSLSLDWRITHRDGRWTRMSSHTNFPEFVCGDLAISDAPEALSPGQQRIEAYNVSIHRWGYGDKYFDQFLGQFVVERNAVLADAVELQIDLNAVIFEDGTLIGVDDISALRDSFSTYVQVKQQWYRGILEALDAGRTVAEAFAPVEQFSADVSRRIREGHGLSREDSEHWRIQAAGAVRRWRWRHADQEIPRLLKKSIRLEPFVIRRRS